MALINCPDCDKQVSSNAPACPNCGAPIASALGPSPTASTPPPVQTIEQTSKVWKALQLVGLIVVVGSCGAYCAADPDAPADPNRMTALMGGAALFTIAKLLSWWHHG